MRILMMNNSTAAAVSELQKKLHLGQKSKYISVYTPSLLQTVPRSLNRSTLNIITPFYGYDLWHLYELSFLNEKGKPMVAVGEIYVPSESECIVESKSLKLYLNSFNQTKFKDLQAVEETIKKDLSDILNITVDVKLYTLKEANSFVISESNGLCLDDLDISVTEYDMNPSLLHSSTSANKVSETIYTNLLKSNCLITGQPDWGTLVVTYKGQQIDHESLLKYVISMRQHNEFHEHCVERIFTDICNNCKEIEELKVEAFYTRRGGIDINPVRSMSKAIKNSSRFIRQ